MSDFSFALVIYICSHLGCHFEETEFVCVKNYTNEKQCVVFVQNDEGTWDRARAIKVKGIEK
ncbi:hypothetical protein M0Q28_05970 [Patescibacteria group bacterium]|jgi:Rieske Fe-S protein|nr:hypothetical protein [Patescibacteria group bacterium]